MTHYKRLSSLLTAVILLSCCNWSCAISKKSSDDTTLSPSHIVIKKSKPIAEQFEKKNVVYEIKKHIDLRNTKIVIPEDCILFFNGGSLDNGVVFGAKTQIIRNSDKPVFGAHLMLEGSFDGEALSSYYSDNAFEFGLDNLLKCFSKVHLNKDYSLSQSINISNKDIVLDGGNHIISVLDLNDKAAFKFSNTKNVLIENLTLDFSELKDISYIGETFEGIEIARVENSIIRKVNVMNVNSSSFSQARSFFGILVGQLLQGYNTLIDSVRIEHLHILGNGIIGDNFGGSSAICVGYSKPRAGNATIRNVRINDVIDVDANGNELAEDAGGIHINAFYYDKGKLHYGSLPTLIENCHFSDISKRIIKLQASDVVVNGITCSQTKELFCYAGIQTFAGKTIIKNASGRYNGEFIRVSEQSDSVLAENIRIESTYNKSFPNCLKSFVGVSVPNATVVLNNVDVNLDGGRFVAVYDNLNFRADRVKVKANALIYSLAAVSTYNGTLSFKHSDITLTDGFFVGKDVAFPIQFTNSKVDLGTFIYRGAVTMIESEMRGGSSIAEGNLMFFRGGLLATNSTFIDSKTLGRVSHSNMVVVEGDSFIENVEFTTTGTTFSNGIIVTSPKTNSISVNKCTCTDGDMNIVVRREIPSVVIENMDKVKLLARGSGKHSVKIRRVSLLKNDFSNDK